MSISPVSAKQQSLLPLTSTALASRMDRTVRLEHGVLS
jgi:hypothetical protein